ncbi:hypothetical protein AgCh_040149 [Apium graveolens]
MRTPTVNFLSYVLEESLLVRVNRKTKEASRIVRKLSLPSQKSDWELTEVAKPAAVPFIWEKKSPEDLKMEAQASLCLHQSVLLVQCFLRGGPLTTKSVFQDLMDDNKIDFDAPLLSVRVNRRKEDLIEIHAKNPAIHVLFVPGNPGLEKTKDCDDGEQLLPRPADQNVSALNPIQVAAMAAERRMKDDLWWASRSSESNGVTEISKSSKSKGVPETIKPSIIIAERLPETSVAPTSSQITRDAAVMWQSGKNSSLRY